MDKQQLAEKATETLRPFETSNLMNTIQTMTLQQIFTQPVLLIVILVLLFYGVIRRSKTVLLTLFGLIGLIILARFTLPAPGQELTMSSIFPMVGGGLIIGCVIIYFGVIQD